MATGCTIGSLLAVSSFELSGQAKELLDEVYACGAVLTGRRTAELMDHWGGDVHGGVPIFVPSHRPPGPAARWSYPLVTYVTAGIESAMAQAKAAAGDRNVHLQGGYTAQRALEAGVLVEHRHLARSPPCKASPRESRDRRGLRVGCSRS